ncbi:hypothetical protein AXG93_2752s2170 [Marchantia polymorpha subsp. ruderalis]|uniref:Uncharacterized protein n=1 Tax=Marchantia polymorpha subsp. ruderalis TaxID=1480154 RepID=A0A176VTS3_MARPO|nr:hypothetical protein AXG93_2752s2170 [Marchantia polymorpha subsp. ruderalis]
MDPERLQNIRPETRSPSTAKELGLLSQPTGITITDHRPRLQAQGPKNYSRFFRGWGLEGRETSREKRTGGVMREESGEINVPCPVDPSSPGLGSHIVTHVKYSLLRVLDRTEPVVSMTAVFLKVSQAFNAASSSDPSQSLAIPCTESDTV